jgi:hypothetical protein
MCSQASRSIVAYRPLLPQPGVLKQSHRSPIPRGEPLFGNSRAGRRASTQINGKILKKYTLVFASVYLVLTLVILLILAGLKLKGGASINVVAALAGGFVAAWKFNKDKGRAPTLDEKKAFAWQGLLSVWLISILLALVVLSLALPFSQWKFFAMLMLPSTSIVMMLIGAMAFASVIYYCAIRWSFAWFTNLAYK